MGGFAATATAEEVTAGIDLTGKTVVITGVTAGIGFETMRVLALRGARVLALGRTEARAAAAIATLAPALQARATPYGCNHDDFADVVACADKINALGIPLDIVICNAGIVGKWRRETIGGIEKSFVVNHLSPFLLVRRLLDRITAAPHSRIVMVSSNAHRRAPKDGIEFDNLTGERDYFFLKQYGQTKLANYLFTRSLARRLAETTTTVNALHPGRVYTNIFHNLPLPLRLAIDLVAKRQMKDIPTGASTTCYVATSPDLNGVSGRYFADNHEMAVQGHMINDDMAERLWETSKELTRHHL